MHFVEFFLFLFLFIYFFFFFCIFCNFYKGDLFGEFLFALLRTIPSERVYSEKKEFALARREIKPIFTKFSPAKVHSYLGGGRSGGGRGGGKGNLGVILVRVCEPVFQNLPNPYTWRSKIRTHSYT